MSTQLLAIKTRFTDDTGAPLKGGRVYTFYAGTSTPKETYKDVDLLIPNTNPVLLDDTGAADIYLKGSYRIRVLDRFGALIEEQDDVSKIISRVDAGELVSSLVSAITSLSDTKSEIDKVKLDTGITATPQIVGAVARTQADVNSDIINARTLGVNGNNDDAAIKKAIDYAVASGNKVVFNFDATIKVPSHAANISDAIHSVASIGNRKFTILIEAGHAITTGVSVVDSDYSNFTIKSVDPIVSVAPTFSTSVIAVINAKAPTLGCLIDLNKKGNFAAYDLTDNSNGYILPNCGVKNGTGRGLYVNQGSTCTAIGSVFTGFNDAGCHVSRASTLECSNANFDNNGLLGGNFGAVYASRNSQINGADMSIQNSGGTALRAQRLATITAPDCNASGATSYAALATLGGKIYCSSGDFIAYNLKGAAVNNSNAGVISLANAKFSSTGAYTGTAFELRGAGINDLTSAVITGFKGIVIFASEAATVSATGISIDGGSSGILAEQGAVVSARNCTVINTTANSVFADKGGHIIVNDGTLTNLRGRDIAITSGSTVNAKNCSTKNSAGTPLLADTNAFGFNFYDNTDRGFIWV